MMLEELLRYLDEDMGEGDITSQLTVPPGSKAAGRIVSRREGVLAGLEETLEIFGHHDIKVRTALKDGARIDKGEVILEVEGDARAMLSLERVVLNILMRMSGIATMTARFVEKCEKFGVTVAGTRKTTPGFRYFEKKAIRIGGGHPHRFGLFDMVLIKDNHIAVAGLEAAVQKAKRDFTRVVEVEVSSTEDALAAARAGADVIMLDNMTPEAIKGTLKELEEGGLRDRVKVELSGGITLENVGEFASLGPDIISVGALTTRAPWLDMSMEIGLE
jgi:nicotinate-nucleotide pyrophosphorylase (carboxylating)